MLNKNLFLSIFLFLSPIASLACSYCTSETTYCTSYRTVCTSTGQQCDNYQTTCDGYHTVCDSYSQECTEYDDDGNCVDYESVCNSYSQQCTGYSQHCTSYSTVCTSYGQECDHYETVCDAYEYGQYITIKGKVSNTGNNAGLTSIPVVVSDTQSSQSASITTGDDGSYSARIFAYDDASGYTSVKTCANGGNGYAPPSSCQNTYIYDWCDSPQDTKNFSIAPPPSGYLDGYSSSSGGYLFGWALDPKSASTSIQVHIYQDIGDGQKTYVDAVTANLSRPDINSLGFAGNHGWKWIIPAQYRTGQHKYYAYAVSVDGRANPLLTNSPYVWMGSLSGLAHAAIIGTDQGVLDEVKVYSPTGTLVFQGNPYPNDNSGVRVALGDVNGDGTLDVLTAPGKGGGPRIRVFNGKDGTVLYDFFAYEVTYRNGVFIASGDVDHDGKSDIITSPDAGGGPRVTVFSGANGSAIRNFFAYDPNFRGGVRIASGDVDGDGWADLVMTPGPGGGPHVRIISGRTQQDLGSFFAYDQSFRKGNYVSTADINGDGRAEIITGTEVGGGPHVQVFSGQTMSSIKSFFAYDPNFRGGVRVGGSYINSDTKADILTVPGPGGGPHFIAFDGPNLNPLLSFFAQSINYTKGLFVSGK